jgi:hypothetical protein
MSLVSIFVGENLRPAEYPDVLSCATGDIFGNDSGVLLDNLIPNNDATSPGLGL